MVCQRCVLTVENILRELNIPFEKVTLGEADLLKELNTQEKDKIEAELNKVGFELIASRVNKIIEDIKTAILAYLEFDADEKNIKLSVFIGDRLHYDYSYLSDLFSSIEGITIEQYFISQRIEKVKELLVYDQLSLSEIAYQLGYSSVHHLSAQFKKVTGLTPSHFKTIGAEKRRFLDKL